MTLTQLRAAVRRDLRDEDPGDCRWSDGERDRHIYHALRELSQAIPREAEAALPTVEGSREVDLSSLTDLVMVESVEYPLDRTPPGYRRFEVWGGALVPLDGDLPDGSDCGLRYGALHTLDEEGSTVSARFEDLLALAAVGHALMAWGAFTANRISLGGEQTSATFVAQGQQRLDRFRSQLRAHRYLNGMKIRRFYT
jgi:hypothetical protein